MLETLLGGDPDGLPLLFHFGSPCGAVAWDVLDAAARRHALRFIGYSRPGFGTSTPRPATAGIPCMADDGRDAALLLDELGVDDFVTFGWSGGGARAIACAALLPGRCRAAACVGGTAPADGAGVDWTAGMDEDDSAEYAAAARGRDAYTAYLEPDYLAGHTSITGEEIRGPWGSLGDADRTALTPEFAEWIAATFRRGARQGLAGVVEDGLTLMGPWGLDIGAATAPVVVWHGGEDRSVPLTHGVWLAEHLPAGVPHLTEEDGHFSWLPHLDDLLEELVALAG